MNTNNLPQPATPSADDLARTRPAKRRRKGLRNGIIAGATAITLALGGTTAWALNRYVIDHVEVTSASSYEASQGNAQTTSLNTDTATTTSDTYTNGNTKISVKQVQNNGAPTMSRIFSSLMRLRFVPHSQTTSSAQISRIWSPRLQPTITRSLPSTATTTVSAQLAL